jgi:molecular chaperone GrpE
VSSQAASETKAEPLDETVDEPAEVAELKVQLSERTADLQRLKAEYDNYRRRVERDRQAGADQAAARVLGALLGTLDDLDRARQHDDLHGSFRAVAEGLEAALTSVGLERYGKEGDPFDPQIHEALVHSYQPGLAGPTCIEVYRAGYLHAGRVLRAAQVVVAEPPESGDAEQGSSGRGDAEQISGEASADGTA